MSILLIFFSGTNFDKVHSQVQYQVNSLFIGILSNGDSIVQYDLRLKTNASEITLPLMGGNINEILVRNYLSKYLVYSFNSSTNEIKINTQNESQVRVTYIKLQICQQAGKRMELPHRFSFSIYSKIT